MSFTIADHTSNRVVTFVISDFVDHTVGEAIRLAGDAFDVPSQKSEAIAQHAAIAVVAALQGLRGKRFSGIIAARSFFVGELSAHISRQVKTYKGHLVPHIPDSNDWRNFEARVSTEVIALVNARIR